MDYFEAMVKVLLECDGYWVRQSFKVSLSKEEKREIGKPSIPRPEIDILAYAPVGNEVLALEVKSFLDSTGVRIADLMEEHEIPQGRYKLFTCKNYREVVLGRLNQDLLEAGMISKSTTMRLGLVAGNVYQGRSEEVRSLFSKKGWFFWSPDEVKDKLKALADKGYENEPSIIAAKILLR